MPAGHMRDREVEAYDCVNGKNERRRQTGQEHVGGLMLLPMRGGIPPAEREQAVKIFLPMFPGAIAYRRQIRQEPEKPKQNRDDEISSDRERVPHERAAKLRPHSHRVRVWKNPVKNPRPPKMENRKDASTDDGKQRHAFGEAIDRAAPMLKHEQQHRGDKRAGVRETDPPDEIDDRKRPRDRDVDPPNPDSANQEPRDSDEKQRAQSARNQKPEQPRARLSILQNDRTDRGIDALERLLTGEELGRVAERRDLCFH